MIVDLFFWFGGGGRPHPQNFGAHPPNMGGYDFAII